MCEFTSQGFATVSHDFIFDWDNKCFICTFFFSWFDFHVWSLVGRLFTESKHMCSLRGGTTRPSSSCTQSKQPAL